MFEFIKGKIVDITPKNIVLECQNIGYFVIVPNPYAHKKNEEKAVYIHQYIRDNVIELYGFLTKEEKELFLKLISVSGIGPKSALSILALGSVRQVYEAIESRNDTYLRKFPGIGPKASQQIILDLKGKINLDEQVLVSSKLEEISDALQALGYSKKEVNKILPKLDENDNEANLLKMALKLLTK